MKDFLEWIQTRQRREQREGEMSVGERQQWSRAMPKRRQAGGSPNASRNSETFGTSRQRLERAELAPAFGRDSSGRGRCQSADKPDAIQTLRGTPRHLTRRASVWIA